VVRHARRNCITHFFEQIPYEDHTPDRIGLPPREERGSSERRPIDDQTWIPAVYGSNPVDED
jgi:hypothetical protein